MHFDEWMKTQPRGTQARIYRRYGVAFSTQWRATKRKPIQLYTTAQALSEATEGAVSIKELCEPDQKTEGEHGLVE